MHRIPRFVRWICTGLLWTVVALCLAVTVIPQYLDRVYYRGPPNAHFDGQRFFNPDGDDDTLKISAGQSRWGFIWRQVFGDPTKPVWTDHVAVTPGKPAERVTGEQMVATWVGHATMLVQADGVNILTDPVWSDTAGPFGVGPRRVAEPGIRFEDLPKIDLILVSHNHYDHMDVATLKKLWARDRPRIVTSLGNDAILRAAGIEAVALDWGQENPLRLCIGEVVPPGGCGSPSVVVTRSHHWDSRWFADRNRALWSSFVVKLPHGNFFFSGDTGLGDGKWPAEAAAYGPIRLAAIPIGAFRFTDGQMGSGSHVGPGGAIQIWNGLGRPFAIPIHWGTFRLSWEGYDTPPKMLRAMLRCAGSDSGRFAPARIGVAVVVPPLGTPPPAPDFAALAECEKAGAFHALR